MSVGRGILRSAALAITAASATLHLVFWRSAGAFWRDELISLRLASSPTFAVFRERLPFDSFPALWPLILRLWLAIGADVRLLGLLAGLTTLGALWVASRLADAGIPIVALALIGSSAAMIRYGDSIRGYGFGNAAGLLAAGAMYHALRARTVRAYAIASLIAVVAVQVTYFNAVLIFACCVAAAFSAILSGARREAWKPLASGAIAALTLLPYSGVLRERAARTVVGNEFTPAIYARQLVHAHSSSGIASALVFDGVILTALAVFARRPRDVRAMYAFALLLIFAIGHFLFVRSIHYFPRPWHYLPLLAIAAWCADLLLLGYERARVAVALLAVALAIPMAVVEVLQRQTNADAAAYLVAASAGPDDVVVVYPWYCGVSFAAYYHGRARWILPPPLPDPAGQRYDQFNAANRPQSAAPVVAMVSGALRGGHRVWLVGFPLFINGAGDSNDRAWSSSLLAALHRDASRQKLVLWADQGVAVYERMQVGVFSR